MPFLSMSEADVGRLENVNAHARSYVYNVTREFQGRCLHLENIIEWDGLLSLAPSKFRGVFGNIGSSSLCKPRGLFAMRPR